jgi:hypothetical protein
MISARSNERVASDRGVSNTVAFVLVFSLIVTSAGLVTTVGFDSLERIQMNQQADLSTGAVREIGGEIDGIAQGQRPAYRDSLDLAGGDLAVVNETGVSVRVDNATGTVFAETYHPRTLRYAYAGRNTTYGSGVLASGGERRPAVLVSGPSAIRCSAASDVAVVTILELVPTADGAVGAGSVTIDLRRSRSAADVTRLQYPTTRPHPSTTNVSVSVSGPWRAAWLSALDERGFSRTGGGTVTCDVSQVTVQLVSVRIELVA